MCVCVSGVIIVMVLVRFAFPSLVLLATVPWNKRKFLRVRQGEKQFSPGTPGS